MAKLRHFAVVVKNLERAAKFYADAFDLRRVGAEENHMGAAVYLSDGVVNLALIRYASAAAAGVADPDALLGAHHFGFKVDSVEAAKVRIREAGGTLFYDPGAGSGALNVELKFKDPDGIIFDISEQGWVGGAAE